MDLTIPANTTAVVRLPLNVNSTNLPAESSITESGKPLRDASGMKILDQEDFHLKVRIEAGQYHFELPWK
jgi:hypothetical protein